MADIKKDSFINLYKKILAPSKAACRKDFTFSGYSYGDVFELAAGLKKTLARRGTGKTLCVCTANKAVAAACVLASLAGSCQLILPYSFSAHALAEMYDAVGFDFAITDHPEEMPAGVEIITPLPAAMENINSELIRDPDKPFLRLSPAAQQENRKSGLNLPVIYLRKLFICRQNSPCRIKIFLWLLFLLTIFTVCFFLFWFPLSLTRVYCPIFTPSRRK